MAANAGCNGVNSLDNADEQVLVAAIRDLFSKVGKAPVVAPIFTCGSRTNIEVAEDFLTNYNATILYIAEVTIGNDVMIGPSTMMAKINHPIRPKGCCDDLG
ncbi:Galactoside O-acetyltransferase [Aerococcus viridans]|nr:Galactoside O-acetyltransferase [Aerococcus viridans]